MLKVITITCPSSRICHYRCHFVLVRRRSRPYTQISLSIHLCRTLRHGQSLKTYSHCLYYLVYKTVPWLTCHYRNHIRLAVTDNNISRFHSFIVIVSCIYVIETVSAMLLCAVISVKNRVEGNCCTFEKVHFLLSLPYLMLEC